MNITWKNVLHASGKPVSHIGAMADYAIALGYSHFLWNDRIYSIDNGLHVSDAGMTVADVDSGWRWPDTPSRT